MKPNKIQKYICDVINNQQHFWYYSNDITSPTHVSDIDEECNAQFINLLEDNDIAELEDILEKLYWFIRKFDNYGKND